MDWFERLTGFREEGYESTRRRLELADSRLRSKVNGRSYGVGELELVSLETLRARVPASAGDTRRLKLASVVGDVRRLHRSPEYAGAMFQVASQFNLLEMVSPDITPEDGVTGYKEDPTQGPACAIAAGAATVYRNYFASVEGKPGQTRERQLDGLADLGAELTRALHVPLHSLWTMRNGYALCTQRGLATITELLAKLDEKDLERIRGKLRIGVHRFVEVTDGDLENRPVVSQAFCSALPVAYSRLPRAAWAAFASVILDAAYEATLWAAVENSRLGGSNIVLLTRLGGGAFGNDDNWIDAAIHRSIRNALRYDLDVRIVSYGAASRSIKELVEAFS